MISCKILAKLETKIQKKLATFRKKALHFNWLIKLLLLKGVSVSILLLCYVRASEGSHIL